MKIAIANDHGGLSIKETVKQALLKLNCEIIDMGTNTSDSVDYPDFALKAIKFYKQGGCDRIVLLCGTGIGMSLAANRVPGIRATLCHDHYTALMSREHNDSNCLVIGSRTTGPAIAEEIVKTWIETSFAGSRHQARLDKIEKMNSLL